MIVCVESGKSDTKYKGPNILGKFATKITVNEEIIKEVDSNSNNIVLDNVLYKVGDSGLRNSLEVSKNSNIHKICIVNSMCRIVPPYIREVNLITGTPVNLFFTDEREKIQEALCKNFDVIFDKNIRKIEVKKVMVIPETMGYIYNHINEFKNKLVAVLDIGGLNTNGCIYNNGMPIRETVFTLNNGINILINDIKNELNKGGYNYQDYEVRHLLQGCGGIERDIIDSVINKYLEDIIHSMRANGWNIDNNEIHFTGGGALLLRDYIGGALSRVRISDDCVYDNAKGFYKVGESLL